MIPLEVQLRAATYVFASAATATAGATVEEASHTYELGKVYVVRVFGADVHVFPVLVSIFAMLAIRQLFRSRTETWFQATVLTFALGLLLVASIVQFRLGVAYATALGFGIGAGGMAVVNLFKDGAIRFYRDLMDRLMKRQAAATVSPADAARRRRTKPSAKASEHDVTELTEELDRMGR